MAERDTRRDVEAALAARRELGPDYDDQVADGLADRVEELVARRIADTRAEVEERRADREDDRSTRTQRLVLGIVSVGGGIPITIATGSELTTAIAWAGIVGVNIAAAWRRR